MKEYYRMMLGPKSAYAAECLAENFIGADFHIHQDLSGHLPENWRDFNKQFIPVFLAVHPGKSKISAGLSCGALWTVCKGMKAGDVLLCPDGSGQYQVAEVDGGYQYHEGQKLPHRRPVRWFGQTIAREDMSEGLRNSSGSIGTVCNLTKHSKEIETLLAGIQSASVVSTDPTIEDPSAFAMEKHLEDFLVVNWSATELSREYEIFRDEDVIGQQFPTDTGPIDILAVSKDRKKLLVIELKKGRASDVVVGQIARYMGYVQEELAEDGQIVEGIIIALEDDKRIRWALSVFPNVKFFRYEVSFKLL